MKKLFLIFRAKLKPEPEAYVLTAEDIYVLALKRIMMMTDELSPVPPTMREIHDEARRAVNHKEIDQALTSVLNALEGMGAPVAGERISVGDAVVIRDGKAYVWKPMK